LTDLLFRDDPYLLEFEATVVARRERQGRPAVVLDRTAFYAESGGQPWDTGTLGGVAVQAVVEEGGEVLHVLDGPLPADRVTGRVDAARRSDHRQQHHGQHLLSRAFVDTAGARTVSFHLGPESSSIDLDREVDETAVRAAERRTNEVVWEARPVTVRTVSRREAEALGVRPPEEAGDSVRLVDAEGFDRQPCGGTHPRNTAEVGAVVVTGQERYKGGTRVRFVCGHRVLTAFHQRLDVLQRLGARLSAPLDGLPEAAEKTLAALAESQRRAEGLREMALEGEARRLLADVPQRPAVVARTYEGWSAADLRTLAERLAAMAPCVALLASRAEKAHLVFAQSPGLPLDVPALLRQAVGALGGRGGGKGDLAQGGGEANEKLEPVLADAARAATDALRRRDG
jgi:alanyl-tRNA synthetase